MTTIRIALLLVLAQSVLGQVYCVRIIGHTPHYERIFLSKSDPMRPAALRGVDDLSPKELYRGTNRIDGLFAEAPRERTNHLLISCLPEIPVASLTMLSPGGLFTIEQVRELLRDTVAVPRSFWTKHMTHFGTHRYVFSLLGPESEEYVVDERAGGCAIVFFPGGTFRCVMNPNWECVKRLQDGTANRGQQAGSQTNMK
jgi:hypothetical protein